MMNNESLLVNYVALQSTNLSSLNRNRIVENNVVREMRLIKGLHTGMTDGFGYNLYSLNFFFRTFVSVMKKKSERENISLSHSFSPYRN